MCDKKVARKVKEKMEKGSRKVCQWNKQDLIESFLNFLQRKLILTLKFQDRVKCPKPGHFFNVTFLVYSSKKSRKLVENDCSDFYLEFVSFFYDIFA